MKSELHKIGSYTVHICQDECPENPFESWDCEAPLLAYYGHRHSSHKAYNDAPESWFDVLRLLPDSVWGRGNRIPFLKRFILPLGVSLREYADETRRVGGLEAAGTLLGEHLGEHPEGWGDAVEWMETAAAILEYGGIPCHQMQSNGYCQGDSTLLLAVATPEWVKKVGASPDSLREQMENACQLHGFWQWGDVYGISEITDENGDEIEGASCWGFYGDNHEKSGLLDHARSVIQCHESRQRKQAEHYNAALCSIE